MGSCCARTLRKRALKNPRADGLAPARGQHSTIGRFAISIVCCGFLVVRRGGFHIRPGDFAATRDFCGRTMFAPTTTVWSCVGGGVLDAPRDFVRLQCRLLDDIYGWFVGRGLDPSFAIGWLRMVARADMESAPTVNHKFVITQGSLEGSRPLPTVPMGKGT